jgi:hypothetical protein
VTATCNSHYCTCFGHLRLRDINRDDTICVTPLRGEPEVVKILSRLYIGDVFKAITAATATHDSHYCTCLGHLRLRDINRNDTICVMPQRGEPEDIYFQAVFTLAMFLR